MAEISNKQTNFLKGVYLWMFIGLLVSAAVAYLVANTYLIVYIILNLWVFWVLVIAELLLVVFLSARVWKMEPSTAKIMFIIYSALSGATLSLIFLAYTTSSIVGVFFIAALMFGIMAFVGLVTKRDLSGMGTFFLMALVGIIIAMVVNMFLRSSTMDIVISIIGVILFAGLTAYDMQKLKRAAAVLGKENLKRLTISGALSLYLDLVNLFLSLLSLFGKRRR